MMHNIPRFQENEILFSWLIRYHNRSGNSTIENTVQELFGYNIYRSAKNSENIKTLFWIKNLSELCNNIIDMAMNVEDIINQHSMFIFFKPFMSESRYKKLIDTIHNKKSRNQLPLMGIEQINVKYKICPLCCKEDFSNLGEPYLRRQHQIIENKVCEKHKVDLIELHLEDFLHLKEELLEDKLEYKYTSNIQYVNLSRGIKEVFGEEDYRNKDITQFKKEYRDALTKKGYLSIGGVLRTEQLIEDFYSYYGEDFLMQIGAQIDAKDKKAWIKLIISKRDIYVYPIFHILFIEFLYKTQYKIQDGVEDAPFGQPMWPCLNPICKKYKKDVIKECKIDLNKKSKKPRGVFQCSTCGFTYSRQGPDTTIEDRNKLTKVRVYGKVWDQKLIDLSSNGKKTVYYLAKEMKCSQCTIISNSKRLSINMEFYDTKDEQQKKISSPFNNKLDQRTVDEYKDDVLLFINKNPNARRIDIRKALPKQYSLLYRRYREWCEEYFPIPREPEVVAIRDIYEFWKDKDEETSTILEKHIKDILTNKMEIRITKKYLAKYARCTALLSRDRLSKLPKCEKLLEKYIETNEVYKNRLKAK